MEGNQQKMREALEGMCKASQEVFCGFARETFYGDRRLDSLGVAFVKARAALSEPPRKGKWENGTKYEYEYAYCSECGRMQWAGWDTHKQAKENIESFANDYKFCPGCGAEMEGGVYVQ